MEETTTKRRSKYSPAELIALLEPEYGALTWRPRMDPVDELVWTILSQHTSDLNAERAFQEMRRTFPSWKAVVEAPTADLAASIRGGGLAQQKAPRIQGVLRQIEERTGAFDLWFLAEMPLPDAKAWLKSLPGVGPKTAAVLLCFALGLPAMPVDTHIHRVTKRLGLIGPRVTADQAHDLLEAKVQPDDVYKLHVYLITHGRRVCKALKPLCGACVLAERCPSRGLLNKRPVLASAPQRRRVTSA